MSHFIIKLKLVVLIKIVIYSKTIEFLEYFLFYFIIFMISVRFCIMYK